MIDISDNLFAAAGSLRSRLSEESAALCQAVAESLGGAVSWDAGNEDWASVLDGDRGLAQVYMEAPLVMVLASFAEEVRRAVGDVVAIVEVDDWDAEVFTASAEAIAALFGERVLDTELDPNGFAASDLWFFTI